VGVPFETLYCCAVDVTLPLLRLSRPPNRYPAGHHLFGAVTHVVYVLTT
jgi:hypothetical protein